MTEHGRITKLALFLETWTVMADFDSKTPVGLAEWFLYAGQTKAIPNNLQSLSLFHLGSDLHHNLMILYGSLPFSSVGMSLNKFLHISFCLGIFLEDRPVRWSQCIQAHVRQQLNFSGILQANV